MVGSLFDGRSAEKKIEDAKALLEENGYLVRGPLILKKSVKGPADLVKFFYDRLAFYNPDMVMYYSGSRKRDLDLAKKFIDARQNSGVSKARAIGECCEIIENLFKYESKLGLNFKVTSMSVLGQDSLGWITDKLIDIINGFNADMADEKESLWFDEFYRSQEEKLNPRFVEEANKLLGIEDDNGKKEE